ncbi:MAG: cytoplasmic chaperone TorD family protein [Chloroflexi bacterium]|nr:MAG: cytoplasmic chaperone TorD family protein [Chloroflexota bacterium]
MDKNLPLLYRLLALAFTYPDDALPGRIQEVISLIDLTTLQNPRCPLPDFIRAVRDLRAVPLEHIQAEYTRLFVAGHPHLPCPPYESAYREGVLLGVSAETVDRLYRQWGIIVTGEEVDHVAVELEFTAYLLTLETADPHAAADFLNAHLMAWLPDFSGDVQRVAKLKFYRVAGQLLTAVLHRHAAEYSPENSVGLPKLPA